MRTLILTVIASIATIMTVLAPTASATRIDETNLVPNALALARYIAWTYPEVPEIEGYRLDPLPDHPSGRAIDVMVYNNKALGDRILNDILHHPEFNIRYTIWQQHVRRPNGTGYLMASKHNPRLDHYDHIHVTVN